MPSHSYDILARLRPRVPAAMVEQARGWDPGRDPTPTRASASVAVVRDGGHGLETYLLQRRASMPFAPLMSVFPGGGVDPADDPRDPRRSCAVRETTEETGLRIAETDLVPWAHWITPVYAPVRYDTTFFLAVCPTDQEPRNISGEADSAAWWELREALDAHEVGVLGLMPPTLSVILELAECGSVAGALARGRDRVVAPVLPEVDLPGSTGGDLGGELVGYRYPSRG